MSAVRAKPIHTLVEISHSRYIVDQEAGLNEECIMSEWNYYLQIAISFFAIAAPVGAILIFISLTENHSEADRRRAARIAALSVALVLITSLLAEQSILHFFGINIASFRIAGGIVIMIMVIAMIQARHSRVHHAPESPV